MTPDQIKDLLNRAKSATPDAALVKEINQASVDVSQEIAKRGQEKDRAWRTATDITQDAETVKAAREIHSDAEFMIATLESAMTALNDAAEAVQKRIKQEKRDAAFEKLTKQREAVSARIKAHWDTHAEALAEMHAELAATRMATDSFNAEYREAVKPVELLIRKSQFGGNETYPAQDSQPLRMLRLSFIDPARAPIMGDY